MGGMMIYQEWIHLFNPNNPARLKIPNVGDLWMLSFKLKPLEVKTTTLEQRQM
jgi:hypothetical protein